MQTLPAGTIPSAGLETPLWFKPRAAPICCPGAAALVQESPCRSRPLGRAAAGDKFISLISGLKICFWSIFLKCLYLGNLSLKPRMQPAGGVGRCLTSADEPFQVLYLSERVTHGTLVISLLSCGARLLSASKYSSFKGLLWTHQDTLFGCPELG